MLVVRGGDVLTPDGPVTADVTVVDGRIAAIGVDGSTMADVIDARDATIAPGFIDVQINGGFGIDVTRQPERIDELGRGLTRFGVTAFVPTIITCAPEQLAAAVSAWSDRDRVPTGGAVPLGLHIEGPMLAPSRRGAHPADLLRDPDSAIIDGWSPSTGVVMATLAPELPGALDVISELAGRGVVVSIGHTDGDAASFAAGRAAGATYVTHLFNAMRPFAHRDPGPIGAALADDAVVVGLICDGIHVDPVAVRMAWRALGPHRITLVTDAVAALGDGGGDSRLGDVGVRVGADGVRTAEGTLAGSDLSLDVAVRNLVAFTGCPLADAVRTVTATPADLLGLADRGRLVVGARADLVVLDHDGRVRVTIVGGEVAWRS